MDAVSVFGIVSGLTGVAGVIYAVWTRKSSDAKVHEMTKAMRTIFHDSGAALWETDFQTAGDIAARLSQAERALGLVVAIRNTAAEYADTPPDFRQPQLGMLFEKKVVWSTKMVWAIEQSATTRQTWLVTPDLEPDLSARDSGAVVNRCLQGGKRYVYFYPSSMPNAEEKVPRLLNNIGVKRQQRLTSLVEVVPVMAEGYPGLFSRGNTILYFHDEPAVSPGQVLQEIVITRISERGLFWQEHDKTVGDNIQRFLQTVLDSARQRS